MTVQDAVDKARRIQKDLDEGRLRVPYPGEVCKEIFRCVDVFVKTATDAAKARELVARLEAPEPKTAELPWC